MAYMQTCEDCRFFSPVPLNSLFGICRRFPRPSAPDPKSMEPAPRPLVFLADWCGEFQERPEPRNAE